MKTYLTPSHLVLNFFALLASLSWLSVGPALLARLIVVLVVLHLCFLRHFPSTNLVHRADKCYTSLYFLFLLCFYFFLCFFNPEFKNLNLEFKNLFSVPFVLSCVLLCSLSFPSCSFLLFFLFPVQFSPSVYSRYFLISLIAFFSNLLSFLFSFPITLFCLLLTYILLPFHLVSFY